MAMNEINQYISIIAAIITIISMGFSIFFWIQKRNAKRTEDSNRMILTSRLESTLHVLKGSATNVQLLIRRCDDDKVTKKELQNMARMSRTDMYTAIQILSNTEESLKIWHYGEMLASISPQNNKSD